MHALERDFGPQHPDTLAAKYSLARVYRSQDRNAEAEELLVNVMASQDEANGPSHPHTQMTIKALWSIYEKLGRVEEARMLKQRISQLS
jgi:thioredoxin-like negative regulator of GroEL